MTEAVPEAILKVTEGVTEGRRALPRVAAARSMGKRRNQTFLAVEEPVWSPIRLLLLLPETGNTAEHHGSCISGGCGRVLASRS